MSEGQESQESQVKVNINFPITGPALARCLEVNQDIEELTESVVRFGPSGNSTPHVTLMMGTIEEVNIPEIERVIRGYSENLPSKVAAELGRPYRETLTGRYVMADVTVPSNVLIWRTELRNAVEGYFVDAARMSDDLHVTLAVLEKPSTVIDPYLSTSAELPTSNFSSIDLSEAGPKGTKLNVLAEVKFGSD